jgi:hypothetical protein
LVAPRNPKWIRYGPVLSGHCPYTFLTTELLKVGWTNSRLGWATKIHKVGSCWSGSHRGSVFGIVPLLRKAIPRIAERKIRMKKYDWFLKYSMYTLFCPLGQSIDCCSGGSKILSPSPQVYQVIYGPLFCCLPSPIWTPWDVSSQLPTRGS